LAVIEAMPNYPALSKHILSNAPSQAIKAEAVRSGMRTLRQNALCKAAKGLTTIEEVLRVSVNE
jgi:general secretion pathway protein E